MIWEQHHSHLLKDQLIAKQLFFPALNTPKSLPFRPLHRLLCNSLGPEALMTWVAWVQDAALTQSIPPYPKKGPGNQAFISANDSLGEALFIDSLVHHQSLCFFRRAFRLQICWMLKESLSDPRKTHGKILKTQSAWTEGVGMAKVVSGISDDFPQI